VLKSMETRKTFLSCREHRIRFVYLPKHSSWLDQIEVVFSVIARKVIRRGNFASVQALRDRLLAFVNYFNEAFAKPFRWTYTGRPLQTE
jgi:transposase